MKQHSEIIRQFDENLAKKCNRVDYEALVAKLNLSEA